MTTKSAEIKSAVYPRPYSGSTPAAGIPWREWLARNRADEMRGAERRIAVVKWASIVLLLAAAALWAVVRPYEHALIFAIALGAFAVMFSALHAHRYVLAAVFGAIVVLYNPLFSVFSLSADWQRLILLGSVAPFLASLVWHEPVTSVSALARRAQ